jgi:hypothetical protein
MLFVLSIPALGSTAWQVGFSSATVPNGTAILFANSATAQASSPFAAPVSMQMPTAEQPRLIEESPFQDFVPMPAPPSQGFTSGGSSFAPFTYAPDPGFGGFSGGFSQVPMGGGGFDGFGSVLSSPSGAFSSSGGFSSGLQFFDYSGPSQAASLWGFASVVAPPPAVVVPNNSNVQFFTGSTPMSFSDPIHSPEPSTIGLMGAALGLLAWKLRKRR